VVPEVLNSDEILVDGQVVNLIHVGQGDVEGSTIFHAHAGAHWLSQDR
jgi:hypothetical protein